MTKSELDGKTPDERIYYFEYEYPYVLPENEILDVVDQAMSKSLSPLENAYVRWMMEVYNRDLAVKAFVHPAYWFDEANFGSKYLKAKAEVNSLIREIRLKAPYLKLYSSDYITNLLHDEIQYLRSPNRKERFYGASADPGKFIGAGKKSLHDHEMEEIDRMLECLKLIHDLKVAAGGYRNDDPRAQQSDLDSSIARVIADTKERIHRRENGASGGIN